MSHIPASKMPHAKPHDDAATEEPDRDSAGHELSTASEEAAARVPATEFRASDAPAAAPTPPTQAAPPVHDAPAGVPPAGPGKRPAPGGGPLPYLAFAAVVALVAGGVVAALSLGKTAPEPKPDGRRKGKSGRKPKSDT